MGEIRKYRRTLSSSSLVGDAVVDLSGKDVGKIEDLMIDVVTGRVAYAVLSFGGLFGIGGKLFAMPWSTLTVDETNKRIVCAVAKEQLERAPGFDKDTWPDMGDPTYGVSIHEHYGARPYWD
jgi:sporulation protein YlmC with PRC-barrel domain